VALAFGGSSAAEGEEAAEAGVGVSVGGPDEEVGGAVGEDEAGADDQAKAGDLLGGFVGADDASQGVDVGDRQCVVPELGGAVDQLVGV
jgi:hypothetical protein